MSATRLDEVLARAVAEGLLPDATPPAHEERPWPVVVMTAVGAWVAAVPLCGLMALLFGPLIAENAGTYVVGAGLLLGSLAVLQAHDTPLFLEQLAIPGLLVGKGLLTYSLFRDAPPGLACLVSTGVALAAAAAVRAAWLRTLLGMLAALWAGATLLVLPGFRWSQLVTHGGWALHGLLAIWAAALALQRGASPRVATVLEAVAAGWLIVVLGGLAWITGATFLVGSLGAPTLAAAGSAAFDLPMRLLSAGLALGATVWLAHHWPSLRRAPLLALPAVALPLAWLMPSLGAVLLAIAVCAASSRWRLAALGSVAAAWIVGAFYYQLSWTLVAKAYVMVLAALALGAAAWLLRPAPGAAGNGASPRQAGTAAMLALAVGLTLVVANVGIWQKQQLIAHGRTVLIPLAPVDPRSLMQGDYMALNFALPPVDAALANPQLIVSVDAQGVATPLRVAPAEPPPALAAGELGVQLVRKRGGWMVVTDAWHFAEGQGARFDRARFGEFRVTDDGRALLVGLRDAQLQPLLP